MGFVQMIDLRTDNVDDLKKIDDEWLAATEGKRTIRRQIVTRDRNDPSRLVILVFFDSYESAMENSNLPETQACAEQYAALAQDIKCVDLDVLEETVT